jgi:hypothetical protein
MGYQEKFPIGTIVRIAPLARLQEFKRDWKYHHPLQGEQLQFAGTTDRVRTVGFYHGGDIIYQLESAPGTWHEAVLESDEPLPFHA